ncbi:unnamed protein product [Ranitomeya imitator]|uniref:Uncharacterized protein n=1 Tax=Ranitomeya imitator TaxID=111125 RepID=A0ABN9LVI4_9NEOB|nr:unnamed protein product [Ranitomeya imitator]
MRWIPEKMTIANQFQPCADEGLKPETRVHRCFCHHGNCSHQQPVGLLSLNLKKKSVSYISSECEDRHLQSVRDSRIGYILSEKISAVTMWTGYSAGAGSVYVTSEEQLRRLAYCMKLLPSPLYKKERLMPTNPEAQRRFAVRDEERPAPSRSIPAREKRKREEEVTLREMLAYLDEEEDEKEEKEEDEMAAKIKLDIRLPRSSTRRSRTWPHNVRHQVSQASPMTWKNIMWTILLGPFCRYIGIIGP